MATVSVNSLESETSSIISSQDGEIRDDYLEKIYDTILKATTQVDKLRRLFLRLNCSQFQRRLPDEVVHALTATLCDHALSPQVVKLCLLVLLEASPLSTLQLDDLLHNFDQKALLKMLMILPLQDTQIKTNSQLVHRYSECLKETLTVDEHVAVLNFMKSSACYEQVKFSKDLLDFVNSHFVFILHHASVYQASNPYASTLFRRSDVSGVKVRELDNRQAQEFFTVLNWAKYNTDDQFANICGFSLVRRWIKATTTMTKELLPSGYTLLKNVCKYCVQVMDQACHLSSKPEDVALQKTALLEALSCLDLICSLHPSFTHSVFHSVKQFLPRYNAEAVNDPVDSVLFVAILQFLVHHGESMVFDVEATLQAFFVHHVSRMYWNAGAAFEYVAFLTDNHGTLSEKHDCFARYFPCIFKILAWNPVTFFEEFVEILGFCVCKSNIIEMFHLLLDLPCLTATLMVNSTHANASSSVKALQEVSTNDVRFKPMVAFMNRSESGKGDTFNRLNVYHELLQPIAGEMRVQRTAELSSVLLEVFFQKILEMNDESIFVQLLPVMLERVDLVYGLPKSSESVEKVLADALTWILKQHPSLATDMKGDLMEYVQYTQHMRRTKLFYTHIVS